MCAVWKGMGRTSCSDRMRREEALRALLLLEWLGLHKKLSSNALARKHSNDTAVVETEQEMRQKWLETGIKPYWSLAACWQLLLNNDAGKDFEELGIWNSKWSLRLEKVSPLGILRIETSGGGDLGREARVSLPL